ERGRARYQSATVYPDQHRSQLLVVGHLHLGRPHVEVETVFAEVSILIAGLTLWINLLHTVVGPLHCPDWFRPLGHGNRAPKAQLSNRWLSVWDAQKFDQIAILLTDCLTDDGTILHGHLHLVAGGKVGTAP